MNLDECDRLMQKRDHLAVVVGSDFDRDRVRTALADEVPGLVSAVRKLLHQISAKEEEIVQLKACLLASEEVRDANFKAKDSAFLQVEELKKKLVVGGMPVPGLICVAEAPFTKALQELSALEMTVKEQERLNERLQKFVDLTATLFDAGIVADYPGEPDEEPIAADWRNGLKGLRTDDLKRKGEVDA